MNQTKYVKVLSLKLSAFFVGLACCCGLAVAGPASEPMDAVLGFHASEPMPAALRTAIQKTIATKSAAGTPISWIEQKITASDGLVKDQFGWSVAIDGDTALIGSRTCSCVGSSPVRSVYVFTRVNGTWVETQQINAEDAPPDAGFGWSVALHGSTALIGATHEGRVYVFNESGGTWTQTQKLAPSDIESSFFFGADVTFEGTTAIVGSPFASAAYVFQASAGVWVETQKLVPDDGMGGDQFGNTLALDGSTLIVGAFAAAVEGSTEQGAAYVFEESAGTWLQTRKLTGADSVASDWFGIAVALKGSTAFIGALHANLGQGATYVFDESGGAWTQSQKLGVALADGGGGFGQAIAFDGTTAVVSARDAVLINEHYFTGAAYVFTSSDGNWALKQQLVASDGTQNDFFGWGFNSVAVEGNTILIGAYNATVDGTEQQGTAYFFSPPMLSKSFAPDAIPADGLSTLTITLNNLDDSATATLSADLTDTLPSGVVVAAVPNASTDCTDGTVTAVAGGSSVVLASGASVGAGDRCSVKVKVTSSVEGIYVNTIPSGALQTNLGANIYPATANLKVGITFPEPYCPWEVTQDVDPITHVLFAEIDNTSSATVNASAALEDFTSIIGHVLAGDTISMAVEGNTDGDYITMVTAFIDWNRDGDLLDANEAYPIGEIENSTGVDGVQAIADIIVPADALAGATRLRVTFKYATAAGPCNSGGYGQAEDYTLIVSDSDADVIFVDGFDGS